MEMTYQKALEIQEQHFLFYTSGIGDMGKAYARSWLLSHTLPCPNGKDTPMRISETNKLVPRGGSFEGVEFSLIRDLFSARHNVPFVSGI